MGARAAVKAAAAAAAFILICIHVVQLVSAQEVANPDVVGYWKLKLGNVAIPEEVARLVSRLSPDQVTLFQKAITSKSLLEPSQDASAATFCSAAGLLCTYDNTTKTGPLQDEDCNYVGGSDPSGAREQSDPEGDWPWDPELEWNYGIAAANDDAAIHRSREAFTNGPPDEEDPEEEYKVAATHVQYSEAQLDRARHVYFLAKDMPTSTSGATVPARFFIRRRSSTSGAFLPRPLASALDSLPWPQFLQALRTPSASTWAATCARTLQRCRRYTGTTAGVEARSCARSLEDAADFVASQLQAEAGAVQAEVSGHLAWRSPAAAGSLEVVKVEKRSASKQRQVLCHDLGDFAYTLQACHSVLHTELYSVTLKSSVEPGVVITNVMACHTQTKTFRADHIAFWTLGIKPGDSGVCHFTMPGVTAFYSAQI